MPSRPQLLALAFATLAALPLGSGCGVAPQPAQAFAGAPLRTEVRPDTIEIQVLKEGQGEAAKIGDRVHVHYRLTLQDGSEADSSHRRKPLSFFLGKDPKLIEGLQLGVEGMRVGELRRAIVPPHLGYGARSMGKVPSEATLSFELELMRIAQ